MDDLVTSRGRVLAGVLLTAVGVPALLFLDRGFLDGANEWFALEHATIDKLLAPLPGEDHDH